MAWTFKRIPGVKGVLEPFWVTAKLKDAMVVNKTKRGGR